MPSTNMKMPFLIGLFLICMCGLMLQIIETRILSVISFYYFAFFAISMAMFGMTAGSLFIYVREAPFPRQHLLENLVRISVSFAIAVVVSAVLSISIVVTGFTSGASVLMILLGWAELIVALAAPYVFAGMAISLALTRSPWPVPLVYGVDLVGAATGCLVVLVVLTYFDALSALFLVGALGALAGVFFAEAHRATNHIEAPTLAIARFRILSRPWILAVCFGFLAVGNAAVQPFGFRPAIVKDNVEFIDAETLIFWNSFSRVSVEPSLETNPEIIGPSPNTPFFQRAQRKMKIDGGAATTLYRFDGDLSKLDFLKYDITNLAYSIRRSGRAAIIGVGGGRDLLSAEYFGFRDVTGVELNPIFVDLLTRRMRDYNRLADLPGVHLFVDDGRSWFARSTEHFDLIQMSMVDTWAATGAGAFSLSENGLYTVEGWRTFLRHLTPTGVFTVSRWYSPSNINETGRMMSVAVAALLGEGIAHPSEHLFLASTDRLATLIVSRAPFTLTELTDLIATVDRLQFNVVARPHVPAAAAVIRQIVASPSPETLSHLSGEYHLNLSPSYDDRPFFFQQLRISDLQSLLNASISADGVVRGNFKAASMLVLIILLSTYLVFITILLPSRAYIRRVEPQLATLGSAYFLLIGFGFMFVELGLIQRISIYLGHPVYGLAVGLFGIIVSTGVGSLLSARVTLLRKGRLLLWATSLSIYIGALPYWFPHLVELFASAALPMRALVSLLAIVPSGVLMGFGFPTGMQIVNNNDSRPTPWFWAMNGAAGVLASGLAVTISIDFSISITLWCGAVCYLLLGPVAVFLSGLGAVRQPAVVLE